MRFLFISFCVASAQITIQHPNDLKTALGQGGRIRGSTATFGTPTYDSHINGRLVYSPSTNEKHPHCNHTDYSLPSVPKSEGFDFKTIVMVDRGGCHFVEKVRIAQDFNQASAVIVVDDDINRSSSHIRSVIMTDGGVAGDKVNIPSVLITKREGQLLKEVIKSGEEVFLRLEWDMPDARVVEVNMWMSPGVKESTSFVAGFAHYARLFKDKIDVRPHSYIFNSPWNRKEMCKPVKGKGFVCAMDSDWDTVTTGADSIDESVRQKCIWRQEVPLAAPSSNAQGRYAPIFWDYLERFDTECVKNDSTQRLTRCSENIIKSLPIDQNKFKKCVENDFDEVVEGEMFNLAWSPMAIEINGWRFPGPMTPLALSKAICTGFAVKPDFCSSLDEYKSTAEGGDTTPWWVYVLAIGGTILIVLSVVSAVVAHRWHSMRTLRNQLRYEIFEEVKNQTNVAPAYCKSTELQRDDTTATSV